MLTADWSNHALLFVAYVYGFILATAPWLGDAIDAQWSRAAGVAASGTALLIAGTWRGVIPTRLPPPYSMQYLAFWTLYGVCAWAWMVALLGIARRWMNGDRPVVAYARRAGYGLYIVHQPVIVAVAYAVVQWNASVGAKLVVTLVASIVGTVACTEILARLPATALAFGFSSARRVASEGAP